MKKEWFLPAVIIGAGLIVALSVYATRHHAAVVQAQNLAAIRPVALTDHLIGNPGAPVVLVEYSDVDSEYSKDFRQIMEQVMQNYAAGGDVAWDYRDFPLITNDQYDEKNDEAAECAGALGGPNSFFTFIQDMQTAAPGDVEFDDAAGYDSIITTMGLSTGDFDSCLSAHTYESRVSADYQNAIAIGASGSPYSVLLVKGEKPVLISGAIPYTAMKQILDAAIARVLAEPSGN
jgi:protein-disulfide isomerase